MFNNFSDAYKSLMLRTEASVKERGFREILPQDVFLEAVRLQEGEAYEVFASYGVSEQIALEVFSQKPFSEAFEDRKGEYIGIGARLKELIILSVKIAAGSNQSKADITDFLLSLFRSGKESWCYQFFDFIGINPKDIEQTLEELTKDRGDSSSDPVMGSLNSILNSLENGINESFENMNPENGNPFSLNKDKDSGKDGEKKGENPTPALDFFGVDLTAEARAGKIDAIIGRDNEIERLVSILNRKTKNNPCLVGEPGVGKTAVVEGLAKRIADGTVPFAMREKRIMSLDLGGMVAGTKYRGEFEARIKQIIDEASKLENEVILFIDEIHTIIGAGAGEGTLDAANILKPAMGRGKICVIGATTLSEYQKHIEKDSALERRFQRIEVHEPDDSTAHSIIAGLREGFEEFHNLVIEDSAIEESVKLSSRYITDRYLPDKAIDLIDEACSAKSMTYNIDDSEIAGLKAEIEKLQKDINGFITGQMYHKALKAKEKQREIEEKIKTKRAKKTIPRAKRLHIDSEDIRRVVERITGIPVQTLQVEDREKLKSLERSLKNRIVGQDDAIHAVVGAIKRSRAGIADQNRPIGSFLFFGPTGVGKTELVKVLAREFYGDEKALVKIDMSEYSERASASKLIGSTAGYVGYEEGGMLTEKVRRKPYSIVLFDEIEKGNAEVFNLLLQILEDGVITDGKGREVNFRNTIVVMTSNIGAEEFSSKAGQIGFNIDNRKEEKIFHDVEKIKDKIIANLDEYFAPEFVNRIDKLVFFKPLDKASLKKIVTLQLENLRGRLSSIGIELEYDAKAVNLILKNTFNPEFGARPVRRYVQDKIEEEIANCLVEKKTSATIILSTDRKGLSIKAK
ncbi:MAG TPA: ATP-dependent Clp protease ATP-binding subunit [bacterium]|nr:ATP-dependent Clp protease ATP-binding subunit [bacterium]